MPEEVFIIVVIAIIAGTVSGALKQLFSYLRNRQATQSSGASLTSSELQAMMRKAVESALTPLADRLDAIEDSLAAETDPRQLAARQENRIDASLLDEHEGPDSHHESPEMLRRRSKT